MQKNCRLFKVTGRVQGVWYRKSTQQQALQEGLTGWAVNLDDGGVEVCLCGSTQGVAKVAAWLHQGPKAARVDQVIELEVPNPCHVKGFTTG
ncbi:acylphosphatase [Marinospirillum celere]|uniref:acylphosphatase n=1 Tax=Marinospirillum celere TaxID=1122252 RepID=A0A1I1EKQ2_9GAMM|nr:acylphosphatase [Marinospirillum celere]SFB87724.1 acylphosphatase [Marinospirillum celere]